MAIRSRRRREAAGEPQIAAADAPQAFAAGAFYSPIVHATEVLRPPDVDRVWPADVPDPPGIDVRSAEQLALLGALAEHPLPDAATWPEPAYDPANDQFPPQDAALLYAMVRHLRPSRLIEVGCGWSTTVTARAITDGGLATRLTCVEPYPRPFLHAVDAIHELREEKVEHTPMGLFDELAAGDVLFIDSSHVVKTGSDVVHLLLQVVPRLADGVVVHVHDIFLPRDYPQGWVRAGFGWTEQYLLQAYLANGSRTRVLAMNQWLALRHPAAVTAAFGDIELDGSSVWFAVGAD
jgi:predicted O-methyltransferase YrrM